MFEILKLRAKIRKEKEQEIRERYGNEVCGTCKYSRVHFDFFNDPHLVCKLKTEFMGDHCKYHCEREKKGEVSVNDVK